MPAPLKVAEIENGCCISVQGRGTMRESRPAREVAMAALEAEADSRVVVDLTACDYLDSTFIGCLMDLYRASAKLKGRRFHLAATAERRKKLLGAMRLDTLIPAVDEPPAALGSWVEVPSCSVDSPDTLRHVADCHRRLAELGGPMAPAFERIARQMDAELATKAQG